MLKKLIAIALCTLGASNAMAAVQTAEANFTARTTIADICIVTSSSDQADIGFNDTTISTYATFSIKSNTGKPVTYSVAPGTSQTLPLADATTADFGTGVNQWQFVNETGTAITDDTEVVAAGDTSGEVKVAVLANLSVADVLQGDHVIDGTITINCGDPDA